MLAIRSPTAHVADVRCTLYNECSEGTLVPDARFNQVLAMIQTGLFGQPTQFQEVIQSITQNKDFYLVGYDFPSCTRATVVA